MTRPSLLIWCHPRTMSSYVYQTLEPALAHHLRAPEESLRWEPDLPLVGEVLTRTNLIQRADDPTQKTIPMFFNGAHHTGFHRLVAEQPGGPRSLVLVPMGEGTPWVYEDIVARAFSILDRFRGGYLIKEVSQPWLIREYLLANPGTYRTLHLRRNLADVAYRMDHYKWGGPVSFSSRDSSKSCQQLLVEGLVQIQRTIFDPFPFDAVLDWEEVVHHPDLLWSTVEGLGYSPVRSDWFHVGQGQIRDQRLAYRDTPGWQAFDRMIRQELHERPL